MIRLNRLTDYAVVIMAELAQTDAVLTSGALARRTTIPQPTVAKLLKVMTQRGLAVAHRGRAGGYGLTRGAREITVAEVIEAVEGPLAVSACVEGTADRCGFEKTCPMHGRWDKVNLVIRRALQSLTLADMAVPAPPVFAGFNHEPAASPVAPPA